MRSITFVRQIIIDGTRQWKLIITVIVHLHSNNAGKPAKNLGSLSSVLQCSLNFDLHCTRKSKIDKKNYRVKRRTCLLEAANNNLPLSASECSYATTDGLNDFNVSIIFLGLVAFIISSGRSSNSVRKIVLLNDTIVKHFKSHNRPFCILSFIT